MRFPGISAVSIVLFIGFGCHSPSHRAAQSSNDSSAILFKGMGRHHRSVTTSLPLAQRYFDQGLTFAYAFNHDEAIRSFQETARLDPLCAMAHWGVAYCNGPHINNPIMDEASSRRAWDALQSAISLRQNANAVEKQLIDALAKRYASPPPINRRPLDEAYAAAMREVWKRHPDDADIAVLFAESLMDLRPWDLWKKSGDPHVETVELIAALEQAMAIDPLHPGANHLYIHAVEASPNPARAMVSADRLRTLVPAAGHLVHMPAHIDVRMGQWQKAAQSNVQAIKADREYRKLVPNHGFYHIYMAHNHHFLAFTGMMEGRSEAALRAARDMLAGVPPEYAQANAALVDGYMPIAMDVLMRFGRWDDILAEPQPPAAYPITNAYWRFKRATALAARGQVEDAVAEQARFREAVARVPADAMISINNAHKVLSIAEKMLAGEIAYRKGAIDESVRELKQAVSIEDDLLYMEPPEWIQPVRHTLGAVLVSAKRYDEAEEVYRADLLRWPNNGWSLFGLAQCLRAKGITAEAKSVERQFRKAWDRADTTIGSTCLCVTF
jgi:tetratricopeptide (TPR) repeat protein